MSSTIFQLSCLTADTGIPLFVRTAGNAKQLSFPVMASLNGVDMFARNHGIEIVSTRAGQAKIMWKIFKQSLKLIAISKNENASDFQMQLFLENVFNVLVLIMGLSELEVIKNVEKFKRDVRRSLCIVDSLLEGNISFGSVTQCVDVILCNEIKLLQETLDAFVSACDSEFGCLVVHGKIVVATEKWWQLLPMETMLLILLTRSGSQTNARDFPIYLPHGSPNVPHRLLTMEIIEGVEVCVICGPEPSLQTVLKYHLARYWLPLSDVLTMSVRSHPRNLPATIVVDNKINGFILVNLEEGKCLSSIFPCGSMTGSHIMDDRRRKKVLTEFYLSLVGEAFTTDEEVIEDISTDFRFNDEVTETYQCADDYKLYANQYETCQFFILFSKEIPTYAMPTFAERTFRILTKDRL